MYGYSALSSIESGTRALSRRGGRYSAHAWPCHIGSSRHSLCCESLSEERSAGCVRKADVSLPVEVRSGQSRAGRPGVSLAGVAVTRGLKRRQRVDGVCDRIPKLACCGGRAGTRTSEGSTTVIAMPEGGRSTGGLEQVTSIRLSSEPKRSNSVRRLVTGGGKRQGTTGAARCIAAGSRTDPYYR